MRKTILMAVFSALFIAALACSTAQAGDLSPLEKLGTTRARVNSRLAELQRLVNSSVNGVTLTDNTLLLDYQSTLGTLQKRIQQEMVKPADTRDQAVVDTLTAKSDKVNLMWYAHSYREQPVFSQQLSTLQDTIQQLNNILNSLIALDQPWIRSDVDPSKLTTLFAALDKKIDDLTAQAAPLIENYKKINAEHERLLQD